MSSKKRETVPDGRPENAADGASSAVLPGHLPGRGKRAARVIFRLTVIALASAVLIIMYGPWKKLSDLYITTAMHTSEHRWLATAFYSSEYIDEVLERNGTRQPEGISGVSSFVSEAGELRFIRLKGPDAKGYIIIAPDSENLRFVFSDNRKDGQLLEGLASGYGAKAAINAGGYRSKREKGVNWGLAVSNGELVGDYAGDTGISSGNGSEDSLRSFAALDYENRLFFGRQTAKEILSRGYRDVIEFGPLLLLDGERADISGSGGGLAPRTAIGQTAGGEVLLLVLEGRSLSSVGATYYDVQDIMLEYGAVNALNLDGGFSSSMYYDGDLVADPVGTSTERMIPSAIIII